MTDARPRLIVGPAVSAPAMSVLTVRPTDRDDGAMQRWEAQVERVVSTFSGFLGTEVLTATGGREDRTLVHRFTSTGQVETWLASDARAELLRAVRGLVTEPPKQQILVGEADRECVTVVRAYLPAPADEQSLLAWHQRSLRCQRAFPGFRGSELLRPVPGQQEAWTVVFRFASQLHLEHWLGSAECGRLDADGPCGAAEHDAARGGARWVPLRATRRGRRRGAAGAASGDTG